MHTAHTGIDKIFKNKSLGERESKKGHFLNALHEAAVPGFEKVALGSFWYLGPPLLR